MRELQLSTTNSSLLELVRWFQQNQLNIDPLYGRGPVWGSKRAVALIESLTIGLPIGPLFINERPNYSEWPVVIDGKQRILAVYHWIEDRLVVPFRLFDKEGPYREPFRQHELPGRDGVRFSELSEAVQCFWRHEVRAQVCWSRFQGSLEEVEEQERKLFNLINFGGIQ